MDTQTELVPELLAELKFSQNNPLYPFSAMNFHVMWVSESKDMGSQQKGNNSMIQKYPRTW